MAGNLSFPLHGPSVHIVRQCEQALGDILSSKFGCTATFENIASLLPQKTVVSEKRFAGVLSVGIKVSVWKDDLTNVAVDAIVNAANEKLHHGGGLAHALSSRGGPQIQQDSKDYIRRHGYLKTGDAIICAAGLLPCKKIIHAVGPYLPANPSRYDVSQAQSLLKKAIWSILDKS